MQTEKTTNVNFSQKPEKTFIGPFANNSSYFITVSVS